MKMSPQVSFYQTPLLEYAPYIQAQYQNIKNHETKSLDLDGKNDLDTIAKELDLKPSQLKDVKQVSIEEVFDKMSPLLNKFLTPPFLQPKQVLYPMA